MYIEQGFLIDQYLANKYIVDPHNNATHILIMAVRLIRLMVSVYRYRYDICRWQGG